MTLSQKLSLTQKQVMVLTPALQQAIRLLQLARLDLVEEVSQELLSNPVLEEVSGTEDSPLSTEAENRAADSIPEEDPLDRFDSKIDVEAYFQDMADTGMKHRGSPSEIPADAPDQEQYLGQSETLSDHLLWQVGLSRMSEAEAEVARRIVGNLREDGYLAIPVEELAEGLGETVEFVGRVLAEVQVMDPVGVAARDLRECLLIQLRRYGHAGSEAERMVDGFLPHLERDTVPQIASRMGISAEAADEALHLIRTLDPKPGLKYCTPFNPTVVPDVTVEKVGGEWTVLLNDDGMPRLRLSSKYRTMADEGSSEADSETTAYLKEKFRSAMWFLKSIDERQKTIHKVSSQIVEFQREFLDRGPSAMRPLTLRDIAERVGVHESTVSRVVSNKYMQTPRGILPMKYFFPTGLSSVDGADVSSMRVKERIKALVAVEDQRRPMSDQRLVNLLAREKITLARRTVAKYREELHIPTSGRRKKP